MYRVLATWALLAILSSSAANAQTRQEQFAELLRVQGVQDIFAQTLEQSKAASEQLGHQVLSQLLDGAKNVEPATRMRIEGIFNRYLDRCATMWKVDELVALWSASYGSDLSDADVAQMLAYYKSPVGVKDVAAGKKAARAFAVAMNDEGQRRMKASVDILVSDIAKEVSQ